MASFSASSTALTCHDILATIFDRLAPGRIDLHDQDREAELLRQSCRNALAVSARACTVISHHALNVLWRELDDVHPLLKVLPNYKRVDSQFVSRRIFDRVFPHSSIQYLGPLWCNLARTLDEAPALRWSRACHPRRPRTTRGPDPALRLALPRSSVQGLSADAWPPRTPHLQHTRFGNVNPRPFHLPNTTCC